MKKIIISVTNDLVSDQRVHKVACSLVKMGFEVLLTGRRLSNSLALQQRPYKTRRIKLLFNKGPLFYAEYNFRLFFYLLFGRFDIALSNDLDTLPANFFASKIRCKKLVYDSHEYFTEVPELVARKTTRNIWLMIEKLFLSRVKFSYTVCDSIAKIYSIKYGIKMGVVRNLPVKLDIASTFRQAQCDHSFRSLDCRTEFILNNVNVFAMTDTTVSWDNKKVIIYQGALNLGRGIELVIQSMKLIDNSIFIIVGDGDITEKLKKFVAQEGLSDKVIFTGKVPFEKLSVLTKQAHAGVSLEENLGLNYYYALPNKLFDYVQAGLPVLVSDFPEMKKIVSDYKIGLVAENRSPEAIADYLKTLLFDEDKRTDWKINLEKAAEELCWENEEENLVEIFGSGEKTEDGRLKTKD